MHIAGQGKQAIFGLQDFFALNPQRRKLREQEPIGGYIEEFPRRFGIEEQAAAVPSIGPFGGQRSSRRSMVRAFADKRFQLRRSRQAVSHFGKESSQQIGPHRLIHVRLRLFERIQQVAPRRHVGESVFDAGVRWERRQRDGEPIRRQGRLLSRCSANGRRQGEQAAQLGQVMLSKQSAIGGCPGKAAVPGAARPFIGADTSASAKSSTGADAVRFIRSSRINRVILWA